MAPRVSYAVMSYDTDLDYFPFDLLNRYDTGILFLILCFSFFSLSRTLLFTDSSCTCEYTLLTLFVSETNCYEWFIGNRKTFHIKGIGPLCFLSFLIHFVYSSSRIDCNSRHLTLISCLFNPLVQRICLQLYTLLQSLIESNPTDKYFGSKYLGREPFIAFTTDLTIMKGPYTLVVNIITSY